MLSVSTGLTERQFAGFSQAAAAGVLAAGGWAATGRFANEKAMAKITSMGADKDNLRMVFPRIPDATIVMGGEVECQIGNYFWMTAEAVGCYAFGHECIDSVLVCISLRIVPCSRSGARRIGECAGCRHAGCAPAGAGPDQRAPRCSAGPEPADDLYRGRFDGAQRRGPGVGRPLCT